MSQHDYILDDAAGPAFRADLNALALAIASLNSGASAPATTYAYQFWIDTTAGLLKQRDASNSSWLTICRISDWALSSVQSQASIRATTSGSATSFAAAPAPAISSNASGTRLRITFHTAAGTTPTMSVSGLSALNLKYKDSTGTKQPITATQVPSGWIADVECDGTDWVVLNVASASGSAVQIQPISASVGSNALTISASALSLDFRSATLGNGAVTTVSGSPASIVVPSSATLGTINATAARLAVLALNNAGTIELAVVNLAGGNDLTETGLISTTALSAAATANNVIYSTTARTNVAYRVIGYLDITEATAGTWATAPSTIQGAGGNAVAGWSSIGYGQTWQAVTRNAGTTYYNTTGRPIVWRALIGVSTNFTPTVNGYSLGLAATVASNTMFVDTVVPPGQSYSFTASGSPSHSELR